MIDVKSPEWLSLSKHVGDVLSAPEKDMTLHFGSMSGEQILWKDPTSGYEFFTEHDKWLQWVAGIAPAQHITNYSAEIISILASWAFEPLFDLINLNTKALNSSIIGNRTSGYGFILTLFKGTINLPIFLKEICWQDIHSATRHWLKDSRQNTDVVNVSASLCLGFNKITYRDYKCLVKGIGLKLNNTLDINKSELWLKVGGGVAHAQLIESDKITILSEFSLDNLDYHKCGRELIMNDIPFQLTAEIGNVEITLSELQKLKPGDVLSNIAELNSNVRLCINGSTVAWGQLGMAEDGWFVRITSAPAVLS